MALKPVRKPVKKLRRKFHGTIMQISIMKTLVKHQFDRNQKVYHNCLMVYDCVTEHQAAISTFGIHTFPLWNCCCMFNFRLCSPVSIELTKLHPNVCSIRFVINNKTKKMSLQCFLELFLLSQILSPDGSTLDAENVFYNKQLPICIYMLPQCLQRFRKRLLWKKPAL